MSGRTVRVLLMCFIPAAALAAVGLSAIGDGYRDGSWSEERAAGEIASDVEALVDAFDKDSKDIERLCNSFAKRPYKDDGIRGVALWGIALDRVRRLPNVGSGRRLRDGVLRVGARLAALHTRAHSYVEDRIMRGWPMYVSRGDRHPTHDVLNAAYIMIAVAKAARAAAEHGEHGAAARLLGTVLWTLRDGFFNDDPEKTKLGAGLLPVHVPDTASRERLQRYLSAQTSARECLESPQAYNKVLTLATACIESLLAAEAVDWKRAEWPVEGGWDKRRALTDLRLFVKRAAGWWKASWTVENGAAEWKYWDVCKGIRGSAADRPEDVSHGASCMAFVEAYAAWGGDSSIGKSDVGKLIKTFVKNIVVDTSAGGGDRFACAVDGDTRTKKQCRSSRSVGSRPRAAAGWLAVAHLGGRCDGEDMAWSVLDMALPPGTDPAFKKVAQSWASEVIQAKYFFYNRKGSRC